jgi:hypothetical protein
MVSTGGMGMLSGVCAGTFQTPSPQILAGMAPPSNLSVTGDELQMYFSSGNMISAYQRASTSVLFADPGRVGELDDACSVQVGGMDVTLDGLRLYIACSDDFNQPGTLRVATRADRLSAFVLSPQLLGTVGNSISISQDELTLYAVTQPGPEGYTLVYQRASVDEPFGPGELVQGLGGSFSFPEISPDGLDLFGVAGPVPERLVVATRAVPSGSFSAPTSVGLPAPAADGSQQLGPTVAQRCNVWYLNFAQGASPSTINRLTR